MSLRFNPPPGWSGPPEGLVPEPGWQPGPGWQPDPSWPPAPPGWQFWVSDDVPEDPTAASAGLTPTLTESGNGAQQASAGAEDWSPPTAISTAQDVPPGPDVAAPAQPPSQTSQLAIAAFVLGALGFAVITALLGIVLGAVAVSRMRWSSQGGKALAIWGIVLGVGWLVLLGIGAAVGVSFTVGNVPGSQRVPSSRQVPGSQEVPFSSLVTGTCFDLPSTSPASELFFVQKTPCNQPHNSQVFATFQASGSPGSYPGVASLNAQGNRGCATRAKESLDSTRMTSSMRGAWLYPHAGSWQTGDRTISCIIYSPTPMSSSVLRR